MLKVNLFILFTVFTVLGHGQSTDSYVRVYGNVFSQKDSSGIPVSLHYEKLPYYDDMGTTRSASDGAYELYLVADTDYTFKLQENGFLALIEELKVVSTPDSTLQYDFYIKPESEPDLITLENLIFARGSDVISKVSYEGLNELVNFLEERPTIQIQLEGHTDFAGNSEANMRLSQSRVVAVKEYLVDKGVKKNRVLTKAFGGTQPLFTERTDEAKTKNRRVEVRVVKR